MVSSVDMLFKYFIANSYLAQVPVECLLFYCLIDPQLPPPVVGHAVVWLLFNVAQTVIISVAATNVNTQVTHVNRTPPCSAGRTPNETCNALCNKTAHFQQTARGDGGVAWDT